MHFNSTFEIFLGSCYSTKFGGSCLEAVPGCQDCNKVLNCPEGGSRDTPIGK